MYVGMYAKRDLGIYYKAKETYLQGKRDLFTWQKRPIYMAKETYSYGKDTYSYGDDADGMTACLYLVGRVVSCCALSHACMNQVRVGCCQHT